MKQIKLYDSNLHILVDDEDFEFLSRYVWYEKKYSHTSYAQGVVNGKLLLLHRFLLNISDSKINVDHRNLNGLDNQKLNLRRCTKADNLRNRSKRSGVTSEFKGVSWVASRNKWVSQICINGQQTSLGRFENEIDAAKAYDKAAKKYYGEFARLNFSEEHLVPVGSESR